MKNILLAVVILSGISFAQNNPMVNQRWNTFNINKVSTVFNNTGLLCNGNELIFTIGSDDFTAGWTRDFHRRREGPRLTERNPGATGTGGDRAIDIHR